MKPVVEIRNSEKITAFMEEFFADNV